MGKLFYGTTSIGLTHAERPRRASNFPGLSSRYGTSLYNHNYVIPSEASLLYFNLNIKLCFCFTRDGLGGIMGIGRKDVKRMNNERLFMVPINVAACWWADSATYMFAGQYDGLETGRKARKVVL